MNVEDKAYSNEHQKRVVERLHKRRKSTAVVASANSEIEVYLNYGLFYAADPDIDPYEVSHVKPLPDSNQWQCKVTLRANWEDVDE